MSMINTNITSLVAQQNLMEVQQTLFNSMERLSSGLRINSASDDAAGLAIANRLSAQITGLDQAQRNANDGISLAQIAEGGLNQVNANLQRIRELSVQAANGTNNQDDLSSIQDEINQRLNEIDRISTETFFNGTPVLATDELMAIQVGADDDQTIDIDLDPINVDTLGLNTFNVDGPEGTAVATSADIERINDYLDATGVESLATSPVASLDGSDFGLSTPTAASLANDDIHIDVQGNLYAEINLDAGEMNENDLEWLAENGIRIEDAGDTTIYMVLDPEDAILAPDGTLSFDAVAANLNDAFVNLSNLTFARSVLPMETLDSSLNTVDGILSSLGAVQNRFASTINNLTMTEINLEAARSRTEDVNYADEVARMTRAQILQESSMSLLAQANQNSQNVLSLLS
ncbi:flagellin FliC [Halomonas alkaliantarctica]|nr:flagellin FliC [Halomonas alkaliantarctica]